MRAGTGQCGGSSRMLARALPLLVATMLLSTAWGQGLPPPWVSPEIRVEWDLMARDHRGASSQPKYLTAGSATYFMMDLPEELILGHLYDSAGHPLARDIDIDPHCGCTLSEIYVAYVESDASYLILWRFRGPPDELAIMKLSEEGLILEPGVVPVELPVEYEIEEGKLAFVGDQGVLAVNNTFSAWTGGFHLFALDKDGQVLNPEDPPLIESTNGESGISGINIIGSEWGYLVTWTTTLAVDYTTHLSYVLLSPEGQPLGEPLQLEGEFVSGPIAYDGTNYLMTWVQEDALYGYLDNLYGQRLSPTGEFLDPEPILLDDCPSYSSIDVEGSPGGGFVVLVACYANLTEIVLGPTGGVQGSYSLPHYRPLNDEDIHYDGELYSAELATLGEGEYMGIWTVLDEADSLSYASSEGAILDAEGNVGEATPISLKPSELRHPRAAFNGSNYLMIWEAVTDFTRPTVLSSWMSSIWGVLLSPEGEMLAGPFPIIEQAIGSMARHVESDGEGFLVIQRGARWDNFYRDRTYMETWTAKVTGEGEVIPPGGRRILGGWEQGTPGYFGDLAFDGSSYLYCVEADQAFERIDCMRLSREGETQSNFAIGDNNTTPFLACQATLCLCVWEESHSILGARVDRGNAVLDSPPLVLMANSQTFFWMPDLTPYGDDSFLMVASESDGPTWILGLGPDGETFPEEMLRAADAPAGSVNCYEKLLSLEDYIIMFSRCYWEESRNELGKFYIYRLALDLGPLDQERQFLVQVDMLNISDQIAGPGNQALLAYDINGSADPWSMSSAGIGYRFYHGCEAGTVCDDGDPCTEGDVCGPYGVCEGIALPGCPGDAGLVDAGSGLDGGDEDFPRDSGVDARPEGDIEADGTLPLDLHQDLPREDRQPDLVMADLRREDHPWAGDLALDLAAQGDLPGEDQASPDLAGQEDRSTVHQDLPAGEDQAPLVDGTPEDLADREDSITIRQDLPGGEDQPSPPEDLAGGEDRSIVHQDLPGGEDQASPDLAGREDRSIAHQDLPGGEDLASREDRVTIRKDFLREGDHSPTRMDQQSDDASSDSPRGDRSGDTGSDIPGASLDAEPDQMVLMDAPGVDRASPEGPRADGPLPDLNGDGGDLLQGGQGEDGSAEGCSCSLGP